MGIEQVGRILAPALFLLNLPVAGVEGGLKILLAWMLVNATMAE
jgi:hypothetical protein